MRDVSRCYLMMRKVIGVDEDESGWRPGSRGGRGKEEATYGS